MPRPAATAPWAYVKVAEGCDRKCGFCAIPSFRGPQRSRTRSEVVAEVESLAASGVREVVLVAQDLASYGRDPGHGSRELVPLLAQLSSVADPHPLLSLSPSELTAQLLDPTSPPPVPYF